MILVVLVMQLHILLIDVTTILFMMYSVQDINRHILTNSVSWIDAQYLRTGIVVQWLPSSRFTLLSRGDTK